MKRLGFLLAIALAVAGLSARAETPAPPPTTGLQPMPAANWLFAQTGSGFTSDGKTLTITGVSSQTLMFSDRPERMTADAPTAKFVSFWTEGKDSFEKDPPNASVSFTADGKPDLAVVELTNRGSMATLLPTLSRRSKAPCRKRAATSRFSSTGGTGRPTIPVGSGTPAPDRKTGRAAAAGGTITAICTAGPGGLTDA